MESFTCLSAAVLPLLLSLLSAAAVSPDSPTVPSLPAAEQEAVYLVLESINPLIQWRSLYPDDLCLSGPHGLVCDLFITSGRFAGGTTASAPHVAEINLGYVSDFSSNPPCGPNATLPSSVFSSFPYLRKLFVYRCFTDIASSSTLLSHLWNLSSSLEELVLLDNPSLVGRLSGSIGDFPRLRRLIISGTGIAGSVPAEIGKLRYLEQLVLSRNRLRGAIPSIISGLERLKILDLSGNRLGGELPAEIGRLGELIKLDLSSNQIAGPFPPELGRLNRLEFLDLSRNLLTGGIPAAMAEMGSLRDVYLSENPLGGRIPEVWEKLGGILRIGLSNSGLTGTIPSSMGVYLEKVCYLALDNNHLEGELPVQLKRLEMTAREINLENNAFRGRIPFSAGFVRGMRGKLKVGGNPKLCRGEDLVDSTGSRGSLQNVNICSKEEEIPLPVLLSSGVPRETSPFSLISSALFLVLFFSLI